MKIHTGLIIMISDLASCSTNATIRLLDPLESLIIQIPPLDKLPLYTSKAEAGVTLLNAVRKKLICTLLAGKLNQCFFKVSVTLTVILFIVSTMVLLVFMYFYHQFNLRDVCFPKISTKQTAIKLLLQVPNECSVALFEKLSERYQLLALHAKTSSEQPTCVYSEHLSQTILVPFMKKKKLNHHMRNILTKMRNPSLTPPLNLS